MTPPAPGHPSPRLADRVQFLVLLAIAFGVSRWWLAELGVGIDIRRFEYGWPTMPLDRLRDDLIGTLMANHAQPPMRNVLIGLYSKACDADPACVGAVMEWVYAGATLLIAVFLFEILVRAALPGRVAAVVAVAFVLFPSALYFENYFVYTNPCTALVTGFLLFALIFHGNRAAGPALAALLCLLLLTWWRSLFHPAVFALALPLFAIFVRPEGRRRVIGLGAVMFLLVLAPPAKNWLLHDSFSNSSWLGLNLAQVAPGLDAETRARCDFGNAIRSATAADPSRHVSEALNAEETRLLAAECKEIAIGAIRADIPGYLEQRVYRLISSLARFPYHYNYPPRNWEAVGLSGVDDWDTNRASLAVRGVALGYYAVAAGLWLVLLAAPRTPSGRRAFAAIAAAVAVWVVGVSIAANGFEQQRMRYLVEPAIYAVVVLGLAQLLARSRVASRREDGLPA